MSDFLDLRSRTVAGAVVGNITVTGIKKGDRIVTVVPVNVAGADTSASFLATADDTINNAWTGAGGASSATQILLVQWEARGGGRTKTRTGRSSS
jgi:hypothetical protein